MVQWSLRAPGGMGTLSNQADIVVMGASIGGDCGVPGGVIPENVEIVYATACNTLQVWPENGSQCRP